MARKKNKSKQHQTFHQAIKPFITDSRVLYILLGSVGAGIAIGAALGSQKAGALAERITLAVKQWGQRRSTGEMSIPANESRPVKENKHAQQRKATKPKKKPKPFATE